MDYRHSEKEKWQDRRNVRVNICDLRLGKVFFNMISKAQIYGRKRTKKYSSYLKGDEVLTVNGYKCSEIDYSDYNKNYESYTLMFESNMSELCFNKAIQKEKKFWVYSYTYFCTIYIVYAYTYISTQN